MKLTSTDPENLVFRPIFMNESPEKSMQVLNNYYKILALLEKREHSVEDKKAMANILHNYDELMSGENNEVRLQ